MPAHFLLARDQRGAEFAEVNTPLAIKIAQPLHRAVDVDRRVVPQCPKLGDHPLRLAQRIGTHQHTAFGLRRQRRQQLRHFVARFRVAKYRQPKRRFGNEDIAGHGLEQRTGRVRPPLVIA